MRRQRQAVGAIVVAGVLGWAGQAEAQSLGPFTWQLQPFCNRVTVQVTQNGAVYTMDGFDDQCGGAQRAPVVGVATPNPDGTIGFGWTLVTVPGGKPVHVDARIDLATIGGPWSDSAGNSGTLILGGSGSGAPRPVPTTTVPAGSVGAAALAASAVTSAAIADGAVGAADINTAEVQRRLTGPCPVGLYMTTASSFGTPTCSAGGGTVALGSSAAAANTTGIRNTAIGFQALQSNVAGLDNTAVGSQALRGLNPAATTGGNTAIGSGAMFAATTAFWNTAVGDGALGSLINGASNTAVGRFALRSLTTASSNTAVGDDAGFNATGGSNIFIGDGAGSNVTAGFSNIHIGNLGLAADDSTTRIGATQTRAFMAGVRGVTTATAAIPVLVGTDGQLGTTSSSRRYKFDIADMGEFSARLAELRPVTFRYRQPAADGSTPLDFGLIAEEVADVFPELAVRGADGQIETVAYHKLPALLLNELQAQQRVIAAQREDLAAVRQLIDELRTELGRLLR